MKVEEKVAPPAPVAVSQLKVGDVFSWGGRNQWYMVISGDRYVALSDGCVNSLIRVHPTGLVIAKNPVLTVEV